MKKINTLLVLVIILISTNLAYSIAPIAYHVNIESTNKNTITVPVPKLEMGQYQINSIYVKTKSKIEIDGNRFLSDVLNKGFENISISKLSSIANSNSNKVKGTPVERLFIVEYAVGVDSYDIAQELMKNPEVEYAVPVFNRYTTDFTPNDPDISKQWHIDDNAKKAWDITKGSEEIVIAIVDSGTDWQHPDLLSNIYINPNEIPNNGIDDDKNGYIDDVNGWDFVGNLTFQQAINRQWRPDNDPKPSFTSNDHGTHVAGCASAATNNAVGVASIGFNTKLMPIKCGSDNWNNGGTRGIFRGYEGLVYAAENGAHIINCSWGGPGFNPAEQEIINSIVHMGVLVVASAGNDSENIDEVSFFPTGYNNVLSVGSIQSNSRRSSFTNYGIRTDIYAPGTSIYATLPGNKYGNKSGTSMAGPVAAGLAALIKALHPNWTPHQIAAQLRSTTDPVANVATSDIPLYFGKINTLKALQANANNFAENKTKGMAISENDFNQNSIINNYSAKTIELKLINYLAPVAGVKLEFLAMDKFFDVLTSEIIVNGLTTLDTSELELRIKLNDLNPWYDGFARVLIKYTAESYTDYQLLKIPIVLQTNNSFSIIDEILEEEYATFYDVHSPNRNTVWAVGQNRLSKRGIVYNTTASRLFDGGEEPLTGVYAIDNSNAWATTGNGNLLATTNSGINWVKTDFTSTTSYFNGIGFFNENNGIAVGDPVNNQFGVILTTNGGKNWANTASIASQADEAGLVGTLSIFGDRAYFGTNAGRIIRGRDFGKTWTASLVETGANILGIAFHSNTGGIAIYTNRLKTGDDVLLARSSDGGLNWKAGVSNLNVDLGVEPVELFYNKASNAIYLICKKGEIYSTTNLGATWTPILTKQAVEYEKADLSNEIEKFRLYGASATSVTTLDFNIIPEGAKASVTSLSGSSFVFDSTEISKISNKTFEFENNGDLTIYINSISFEGPDKSAFSFFGNLPKEIAKGSKDKVITKFNPTEAREYKAQLVFSSNNADGDIVIELSGKGFEKPISSVAFDLFDKGLSVYPQPARNEINIKSTSSSNITKVNMLDITGKLVKGFDTYNPTALNTYSTTDLGTGVYLLQFVTNTGTFYKKIIIE